MAEQYKQGSVHVQAPNGSSDRLDNEDEIDLGEILRFILQKKWLILFITLLFTLVATAYALLATPIYQSDAVIQVEAETSSIPGMEALDMMGGDVSSLTEIEIIKSRKVVGAVIDKLKLRVRTAPRYFPVIGAGIARRAGKEQIAPVPFDLGLDLSQYAWGGESIQVETFMLNDRDSSGGTWRIEKGQDSGYRLLDNTERLVLTGTVGQSAQTNDPVYGSVQLLITTLEGRTGTEFNLSLVSRVKAIDDLLTELSIAEKGKKTGIISATLTGAHPELARITLDQLTVSYLKYDVDKKSTEAAQILGFIQEQLPDLKYNVEKTEAALNEYRQTKGSGAVALGLETQAMIDNMSELETKLYVLALQNSELSEKFTALHPNRMAVKNKIQVLTVKQNELETRLHQLPTAERESIKLMRDTKVANELYVMLLNKSQEFKIAKAGVVGNSYILDRAIVRANPIKPKKPLIILIGLFLGLIVAIFLAQFLGFRQKNRQGLSSPEEIEEKTGLPVFVSILHSDLQEKLRIQDNNNKAEDHIIARSHPDDLAVESLRSFRTALQFAQIQSKNNVIIISGPAPGVGKSFVSTNLAMVLADSGKKVIIIDGDLRKGYLNKYFGVSRSPGLSDFILGQNKAIDIVHRVNSQLRFISTGTLPPNPSEVLLSSAFSNLIEQVSKHCDIVLIDTPPILAVTDASIIAKHAGAVFMTMRWGMHTDTEIKDAAKRFEQSGIHVNGLILNGIPIEQNGAGGYNGYYQYQYAYSSEGKQVEA